MTDSLFGFYWQSVDRLRWHALPIETEFNADAVDANLSLYFAQIY